MPLSVFLSPLAAGQETRQLDLADLSLEELGNIKVTSVSKRPELLAEAAASVYIISADDIRRSGYRTLPDVLRLAPNLQVVQDSAWDYLISARGGNSSPSISANKILVLIDGRSVYTPLYSGVFWDMHDMMLEDIERIEVISGPAGTLWGVNAVNGVINVITRPARDTQGGLAALTAGSTGSDASLRYGGTFGAEGHYRLYGRFFDRQSFAAEDGSARNDRWRNGLAGFRADWSQSKDSFSLQGNVFDGRAGQPQPGPFIVPGFTFELDERTYSGVNLTGRWNRQLDDGSGISLKSYYDRTKLALPPFFSEDLQILDVEFQHTLRPLGAHSLIWGANYRYSWDDVQNSAAVSFLPAQLQQRWFSLFAQDEISLTEALHLTAGARLERHPYTGSDFLPNLRLAWKAAANHLLWGAASRTARGPTRFDHDFYLPGRSTPDELPYGILGGPNVRSETANVFEIGYRGKIRPDFSYSLTAYRSNYDYLRTLKVAEDGQSAVSSNDMEGHATGIEMWANWRPSQKWQLSAGFTALRQRFRLKPGIPPSSEPEETAGNDPSNTWQLRSTYALSEKSEFSLALRHSGRLRTQGTPAYTAIDLRYAWRIRRDLEFSLSGQNLFGTDHVEYSSAPFRSVVPRQIFARLVWRQ